MALLDRLDLCQVLNLSCNCLSFDFMGTIPDDTSDEQGTVGAQNSQGWEKRILWFGGSMPYLHLEPVDHLDLKTVILWLQNKAPKSHNSNRFCFFFAPPQQYLSFSGNLDTDPYAIAAGPRSWCLIVQSLRFELPT